MSANVKDKSRDKGKEKPREKDKPKGTEGGSGRFGGIKRFIRETRSELKKVVWPTRDVARNLTLIVAGVSIAVGLFLGGIDYAFEQIFRAILGGS